MLVQGPSLMFTPLSKEFSDEVIGRSRYKLAPFADWKEKKIGHKAIHFDPAPFCADSVHGCWYLSLDPAVLGNWKKTNISAVHDNHVAGYAIRGYSGKLLSTLDCRLLARHS